MRCENDGMVLWCGAADAPAPGGEVKAGTEPNVTVAVQPVDAGNRVEIRYRLRGRTTYETVAAAWSWTDSYGGVQYFQGRLPAFRAGDVVEYLPLGRCAGRQVPGPSMGMPASFRVVGTEAEAARPRRRTEKTDLHFDLSFVAEGTPVQLHVGNGRVPLRRHSAETLRRHRSSNAALRLLPDSSVTHYAEGVELPSECAQLLLLTAPSRVPGAKLDTLLLSMVHVPRGARREMVRDRVARRHPNARRAHPKLVKYGVRTSMADGADPIVDVHDFKTAMDAAVSIVFHHVELVNIGAKASAAVTGIIEYSNGASDLAEQILEQALAHQKDPSSENWAFETPYLDTNLQPSSTSYYNWSDATKEWMKGPLSDSLKKAKNDPALKSTATNAGVYTVQEGTTDVAASQGASSEADLQSADSYWTVNNLTPHHGFEQQGPLTFDDQKFSISFLNSWLRWLSCYVEFHGPDGKAVKPQNWSSHLSEKLAGVYDSDTKKYVAIASSANTILAIPVGNTPTDVSFTWPANASSVKIMAGGIGRTGGIKGADGVFVGGWDKHVCTAGAVMTGIFNFGIPTVSLLAGAAVPLSALNRLAQDVFTTVLDVASFLVSGPVAGALQGGNTTTILTAFVDLIPRVLLDIGELAAFFSAEIAEGAGEEATPVFGWIALAVSVLTDIALLAETTAEVASSPATFELVASRAVDAQWTLLPDPDHQNTWPLEATHYEVTATFRDGTSRSTVGKMRSSPQTGPITVQFSQASDNRLPAGGEVMFAARFYSETGWLAGAARTDFMSADVAGNLLTVPEMHIKENLVPLTSTTVYQFDRKLVYDAGTGSRSWSRTGGPPTATVKDLDSSNVGSNLARAVDITVSQRTSRLGYTWQASGQDIPLAGRSGDGQSGADSGQMFTFQTIDDRSDPESGLRFVPAGFTTQPLLVFDVDGPASGMGYNFWIDPRDGLYHVRQVVLGGDGRSFDLATGESWGRFNQQIDAAAVHPAGYVVGVSTANSKIEILKLGSAAVDDAMAPLAGLYSGYGTRPGLIHGPVGVAAMPKAGLVVLEAADSDLEGAEARLQAFDFLGNPAPVFAGGSPVAPLRREAGPVTLLDVAIESKGYMYVLKYLGEGSAVDDYRLDIYNPDGSWLSQTAGLAAARMTVDLWRTLYSLNYEVLAKPGGGRTEPSVSIWLPSTPQKSLRATPPPRLPASPVQGLQGVTVAISPSGVQYFTSALLAEALAQTLKSLAPPNKTIDVGTIQLSSHKGVNTYAKDVKVYLSSGSLTGFDPKFTSVSQGDDGRFTMVLTAGSFTARYKWNEQYKDETCSFGCSTSGHENNTYEYSVGIGKMLVTIVFDLEFANGAWGLKLVSAVPSPSDLNPNIPKQSVVRENDYGSCFKSTVSSSTETAVESIDFDSPINALIGPLFKSIPASGQLTPDIVFEFPVGPSGLAFPDNSGIAAGVTGQVTYRGTPYPGSDPPRLPVPAVPESEHLCYYASDYTLNGLMWAFFQAGDLVATATPGNIPDPSALNTSNYKDGPLQALYTAYPDKPMTAAIAALAPPAVKFTPLYDLTSAGLGKLKAELPADVYAKLEVLKGQVFMDETTFFQALVNALGQADADQYKTVIESVAGGIGAVVLHSNKVVLNVISGGDTIPVLTFDVTQTDVLQDFGLGVSGTTQTLQFAFQIVAALTETKFISSPIHGIDSGDFSYIWNWVLQPVYADVVAAIGKAGVALPRIQGFDFLFEQATVTLESGYASVLTDVKYVQDDGVAYLMSKELVQLD